MLLSLLVVIGLRCHSCSPKQEVIPACAAAFQVADLARAEQALNDLGVEYHK